MTIEISDLRSAHLILLDADTEPSDVLALVSNVVVNLPGPDAHGITQLNRHTQLRGPIYLDAAICHALGLAPSGYGVGASDGGSVAGEERAGSAYANAFALFGPRDRESTPPPAWMADADGLHSFFPHGLPERAEARNLEILIEIARRLHATVRLADEPGMPVPRLLRPDPEARIMLTVYSQYWLAPDVLKEKLVNVNPGIDSPPEPKRVVEESAQLANVDDPIVLDGYALEAPILGDGNTFVEVGVMLEEQPPAIVSAHSAGPQIAYQLRWIGPEQLGLPRTPEFAAQRRAAGHTIEVLAKEIMHLTAGIGVDEAGFLVAESQLG